MPVSPQYVGMYGRPWTITLTTDSGADNLTGLTANNISVRIHSPTGQMADAVSSGAITIVTANPAQITWQPTASDFAIAGSFQAIVEVVFGSGPVAYDPITFDVKLV